MAPTKPTKKSQPKEAPKLSSGLSSALLLKQKLLAQQQGSSKSKSGKKAAKGKDLNRVTKQDQKGGQTGRSTKELRKDTKSNNKVNSKRPKTQEEEEGDSNDNDNDDEEKSDSEDEEEESAMDVMRRQFEKQFGKVKGVEKPVVKTRTVEKESTKKSKENPKKSKESKETKQSKETKKGNSVKDFLHGFDKSLADSDSEDYSDFNVEEYDEEEYDEENGSDDDQPIVVKYDNSNSSYAAGTLLQATSTSRREKRLFMSSKAPASIENRETPVVKGKNGNDDSEDEEDKVLTQEDMKNDLELQRLLRESHILSEAREQGHLSGYDVANAYVSDEKNGLAQYANEEHNHKGKGALFGEVRLKAMEIRMDSIGMKRKQEKPLNMKVVQQRAKDRKQNRRSQIDEARESGVVLARSVHQKESKVRKRDQNKGLQFKQLGKQTKTGLVLSKYDIQKVTNKD